MILIVDMNCKKNSLGYYEFVLPVAEAIKSLCDWSAKHFLDVAHKDLSRCRAVILSGTPLKDTSTLNQLDKFQWLKETGKPVLGICAGMETIGAVYGSPIHGCLEVGMTPIETTKENSLFCGDFKAYSLHGLCVAAPAEFEVLAKSDKCIQAIKHKREPIYGTLFHPEVRNPEILRNFIQAEGV